MPQLPASDEDNVQNVVVLVRYFYISSTSWKDFRRMQIKFIQLLNIQLLNSMPPGNLWIIATRFKPEKLSCSGERNTTLFEGRCEMWRAFGDPGPGE